MKTAQLTLMIIMGVLVLIAAALVIYFGGQAVTRKAGVPEQQRLRQVTVQPVKDYVTNCLDVTTTQAIGLLTKQGGVIYEHQGGTTKDVLPAELGQRFLEYEGLNVSYAITPPVKDVGVLFFKNPPKYPFVTFPYVFQNNNPQTRKVIQEQYFGYYGTSQLPPLFRPGQDSIQENIEVFIANNIADCTRWNVFAAQGLAISAGKPNATVLIAKNLSQIVTEQFLTVKLNWTVNITNLASNATTTINEFSISYPIKLAQLYVFLKNLIDSEVTDIRFDPRKLEKYPVVIVENVYEDENGGDDVVIVQDLSARLGQAPLEFRFARHNRPPALAWINQTGLDDYKFVPTATCNIEAKNIQLAGNLLKIRYGDPSDWSAELSAFDPDEDEPEFITKPKTPVRIDALPGQTYYFVVCADDGSENKLEMQDCQTLLVKTDDCPTP